MSCGCEYPFVGTSLTETCYGGSFAFFMSILDSFIRNQCDLSEVCKRITPKTAPDLEYDFIIIGGGAAGSVVASRLSEVPQWKILLIESGDDEPPGSQVPSMMNNFKGNSLVDWNFKTEPQNMSCLGYPEKRCSWPRGKVLGGSGVLHGMMYMRGLPQDYDNWQELGNEGWGYEEVMKYFKMSEGNEEIGSLVTEYYHAFEGPMKVRQFPHRPQIIDDILEATREIGYSVVDDLNADPFEGFTVAQANIVYGSRLSSARAFLRPARNRPNLHIMLNSTATKISVNTTKNEKVATGVYLVYKKQQFYVKVKHEVILSAGSINSPQLLLLSGIGPKDILTKVNISQVHDLPGVGQNVQNHVSFILNFQMTKKRATNDLNWLNAFNYLTTRTGPMSSTGLAQLTGRIKSNFSECKPDLQIFFSGFLAGCSRSGRVGEPEDFENADTYKNFSIIPVVLRPKSIGHIALKSENPFDAPLMDPKYLTDANDVDLLIKGIRIALKLAETKRLTEEYGVKLINEPYGNCSTLYQFHSNQFWECAVRYFTGPENHQVGSCKMGPSSDDLAVVNSKLQVYGVRGIRVIDASIMPNIISGNTHASAVMIAEKGAEMIKAKWLTVTNKQ